MRDFLNRGADKVRAVENFTDKKSGRQVRALTFDNILHAANRRHCVCVGSKLNTEADGRIAVELRNNVIGFLTRLNPRNVFHVNKGAVAVRLEDNVAELFHIGKTPLNFAGVLLFLPLRERH